MPTVKEDLIRDGYLIRCKKKHVLISRTHSKFRAILLISPTPSKFTVIFKLSEFAFMRGVNSLIIPKTASEFSQRVLIFWEKAENS